jgi:tetratricopeptide (TPR) repeat protein
MHLLIDVNEEHQPKWIEKIMAIRNLLTVYFILTLSCVFGQGYYDQFKKLHEDNDTLGEKKLLINWENTNPKDPELFIAYFNYFVTISKHEMIALNSYKPNANDTSSLVITSPKTGKVVGYVNSSTNYNPETLQKGFDYIDKGIKMYPNRLDMWFGKIYVLGEAQNFAEFTRTIIQTIDLGVTIKNKWVWSGDKPLDDGENFFLGSLQDYVLTIYNANDDKLLPYMREIAEEVLKYYPNHVESLSNASITYLHDGEIDKALALLLRAETVAPKDVVILFNIAESYKRKKDKTNAKIYYNKIIKVGNKVDIKDAKDLMKDL